MIAVRPAAERGHANHGWLDSHHTFSFADYHDPRHMGFRNLRVINDDRVAPGQGFGTHPHSDMEIVSYVLEGALQHRDSMGTGSTIVPGDVQRMSAGSGVRHSEFNASKSDPVHFLQIWLLPGQKGIAPGYEQKAFPAAEKRGRFRVVASPDGREGSVTVHTDALLYAGLFQGGHDGAAAEKAELPLAKARNAWVQVARGKARVNGHAVGEGDGVAISDEPSVVVEGVEDAEVLVFDLP
jgi:redox-sensitive bicupin YhaK (pirin superfamily)